MGRCMECDRLVYIRQGPQKWGSRECDWYPVPHDVPTVPGDDEGKFGTRPCDGDKRAIR